MLVVVASFLGLLMIFSSMMPSKAADTPTLNKVGSGTVTATQYSPDDKEIGKAAALTDGNDQTRWLFKPADPTKELPLRLTFDMGIARTVGKVRIANYFRQTNFERGLKIVDFFVGDTSLPVKDAKPTIADVEIKMSDKTAVAWTDIVLAPQVKGRYVTIRVKSNWGAPAYAANEVEIYTVEADVLPANPPVTPTPATVK